MLSAAVMAAGTDYFTGEVLHAVADVGTTTYLFFDPTVGAASETNYIWKIFT